jgi:hypothetical protein
MRHTPTRTFRIASTSNHVTDAKSLPSSKVDRAREVVMAAFATAVNTGCPLCRTPILSFAESGHVRSASFRLLPLYRRRSSGEGFAVCDDCGQLASLGELPLN